MATVAQAFEQFMQSLKVIDTEDSKATRQQQDVFQKLQRFLGPKEAILSGSYGRKTAVRPLHDIDLFLVFPTDTVPPRASIEDTLRRVQQALQEAYPGKQARLQNRSVNIEFTGTGIGFDVVPALEEPRQPGLYWIPDRASGTWIRSNPRRHQERCDAANAQAGMMLKPLVKALKRWNQLQGKPISSFLIEVMAYEGLTVKPASYASGLATLFQFMSERIQREVPEPARLGPALTSQLDPNRREQARQRLMGAARRASEALKREQASDLLTAHTLRRDLLGTDYRW
jgi:hypothetical protein